MLKSRVNESHLSNCSIHYKKGFGIKQMLAIYIHTIVKVKWIGNFHAAFRNKEKVGTWFASAGHITWCVRPDQVPLTLVLWSVKIWLFIMLHHILRIQTNYNSNTKTYYGRGRWSEKRKKKNHSQACCSFCWSLITLNLINLPVHHIIKLVWSEKLQIWNSTSRLCAWIQINTI